MAVAPHCYLTITGQPGGGVVHVNIGGNLLCDGAIQGKRIRLAPVRSRRIGLADRWPAMLAVQGPIEAKGGTSTD